MRITKRQLRRIIKEAISGKAMGGPNRGQSFIDIAMQSLAVGDTNAASEAILASYMMDDTWGSEEDALEDLLIDLGPNPTQADVESTGEAWLADYRAGKYRPKTDEEIETAMARGADLRTVHNRRS